MNTSLLDRAIIYAVHAHAGTGRKGKGYPYIVHPLEAVTIVAGITDDQELLAAAALHDVLEDTPTTYEDLCREFGERVAQLVKSESDEEVAGMDHRSSWRRRKEESIRRLAGATRDEQIVALGDKLSNMRTMASDYAKIGDRLWQRFHVTDREQHAWRYRALLEAFAPLAGTEPYEEFRSLVVKVFGQN